MCPQRPPQSSQETRSAALSLVKVKSMLLGATDLLQSDFPSFSPSEYIIIYLLFGLFITCFAISLPWSWCWHSCVRILYSNFLSHRFLWVIWQHLFCNWMELQAWRSSTDFSLFWRVTDAPELASPHMKTAVRKKKNLALIIFSLMVSNVQLLGEASDLCLKLEITAMEKRGREGRGHKLPRN